MSRPHKQLFIGPRPHWLETYLLFLRAYLFSSLGTLLLFACFLPSSEAASEETSHRALSVFFQLSSRSGAFAPAAGFFFVEPGGHLDRPVAKENSPSLDCFVSPGEPGVCGSSSIHVLGFSVSHRWKVPSAIRVPSASAQPFYE